MNIILADPRDVRDNLLPLTYTRPISEIRVGITTLAEKWSRFIPGEYYYQTTEYLSTKYRSYEGAVDAGVLYVRSNVVADCRLAEAVKALAPGQALFDANHVMIAQRGGAGEVASMNLDYSPLQVTELYDIFMINGRVLEQDFEELGQAGVPLSTTVTVIGPRESVYVDPRAVFVEGCVLNTLDGPIYIGPGAQVMEGSCLRGPVAVCEGSTVNMGAKIYGATTIGPHSKVGGELNNVVIFGYSNKAHDGFLGNAVVGEWCNIGAGATASNLKNDYTEIKLWNYPKRRFVRTGLQFCGAIIGDHSKIGINAMLNTATVLGVGVNIHGAGYPRPFLASFSEGSTAGFNDVVMSKFFDTATKVMARRGIELTDVDRGILAKVRELAEAYR